MNPKVKLKRITRYANAEVVSYENAKVTVVSLPDDGYGIEFRILSDDERERSVHDVIKGKIVSTKLTLSKEAAVSLMIALQKRIMQDDII